VAALTVWTTTEVAQMLHVSERTVKRLIATGELSSLLVGTRRRITQEQLDNYVKGASS
jgi:excisionase family DNA binding protein